MGSSREFLIDHGREGSSLSERSSSASHLLSTLSSTTTWSTNPTTPCVHSAASTQHFSDIRTATYVHGPAACPASHSSNKHRDHRCSCRDLSSLQGRNHKRRVHHMRYRPRHFILPVGDDLLLHDEREEMWELRS